MVVILDTRYGLIGQPIFKGHSEILEKLPHFEIELNIMPFSHGLEFFTRVVSIFMKNLFNVYSGPVNRFYFVLTTENIFSLCRDVKYCVI